MFEKQGLNWIDGQPHGGVWNASEGLQRVPRLLMRIGPYPRPRQSLIWNIVVVLITLAPLSSKTEGADKIECAFLLSL